MAQRAKHVLLTGATGFIGRHLVSRLLSRADVRLTLLVRGESEDEAKARLDACVEEVTREIGSAPRASSLVQVLVGDVRAKGCGLAASVIEGLRVDEVWHLAASLSFAESSASETHEHNVEGTKNVLDVAAAAGAKRFVHVSTAYVCGAAVGRIPEALHPLEGPFNNAYERSKCAAEHAVRAFARERGIDYRIIRPSIVVGSSRDYAPGGSQTGLYGFLREVRRMRRVLEAAPQRVRLVAERNAKLNFVAVDEFVRELCELAERDFAGGPVYHLTAAGSPSVGQTLDAICDALGVPRFELVANLADDATPLERLLSRRTSFYASYLSGTKSFARAKRPAPRLGRHELERYVHGFVHARNHERDGLEDATLLARDGFPLAVARSVRRESDVVVLVNALGMPHAALEKLGAALRSRYTLLTWESRGAPSMHGPLDARSFQAARHADDLEDLLRAHHVDRAHLVGWCTGADVALEFARRAPSRVQSLVCLNGAFMRLSNARVPYQLELEALVRRCARSEAHARLYHGLIGELLVAGGESEPSEAEERRSLRSALSVLDPELMHVTSVPLRSPDVFYRYCRLLAAYFDEAPSSLPEAYLPALVVSAEDDAIAHVDASRSVARRLRATLQVRRTGGHFAPCKDDAVVSSVLDFIACHAGSTLAAPLMDRCA